MNEPFVKESKQLLLIEPWMDSNPLLTAGFTTKNGGHGKGHFESLNLGFHVNDILEDVISNRETVAGNLSFPLSCWTGAEQTHEVKVVKVTSKEKGMGSRDYSSSLKGTDGLYTEKSGILLTLCFADCVPLYFYSSSSRHIGVAHAGWKGTVNGIAAEMVEKWQAEGIHADDIHAVIGPSICGDCYVVDDRVIQFVEIRLEEMDKKPYNRIREGQYQLDLKKLNELILQKAGVPPAQIQVSRFCTSCNSDLFFSHRKDSGKTGRMMSFIGWKED
ncbi:peptidoglycan editing factor PgeF [Peribacillus saganii]|uniref:Purine nucleoside phosphorylase n=1 Tax=Peribacillus saganii TaxID=2303992 RepID=A0A372LBH9_9BACI|nr:peptidoglycan editing factor PgeF [Peribacillus saganii]RFU63192.1 peptidoglycan editing factor PgeF [Peribacillus saganii]